MSAVIGATTFGIYNLAPDDMRLSCDVYGLALSIVHGHVWITVGDARFTKDYAEEAAAMRRLAELASEAAAELDRREAWELREAGERDLEPRYGPPEPDAAPKPQTGPAALRRFVREHPLSAEPRPARVRRGGAS